MPEAVTSLPPEYDPSAKQARAIAYRLEQEAAQRAARPTWIRSTPPTTTPAQEPAPTTPPAAVYDPSAKQARSVEYRRQQEAIAAQDAARARAAEAARAAAQRELDAGHVRPRWSRPGFEGVPVGIGVEDAAGQIRHYTYNDAARLIINSAPGESGLINYGLGAKQTTREQALNSPAFRSFAPIAPTNQTPNPSLFNPGGTPAPGSSLFSGLTPSGLSNSLAPTTAAGAAGPAGMMGKAKAFLGTIDPRLLIAAAAVLLFWLWKARK